MVIVHNYSEQNLPASGDPSKENHVDEDRAYAVGIWTVIVIAIILLIIFVFVAISLSRQNEELAEKEKQEQILGEKEKESSEKVTTEVKESDTKEESESVEMLERPLTEEEIIAKSQKITGSEIHTVEAGESLYTVGEKYGIDWHQIAEISNLSPPYSLHTGQKLIIPPKEGENNETKN